MSLKSCNTAYGVCTFYGKDEYIGRSLYNYGEWSALECQKLISLASGPCIDVGANIGYMSMALAASGFPVHAFEPQPALYALLQKNTTGLPVSCYNVALSDSIGSTGMPRVDYSARGNFGGLPINARSDLGHITVQKITLDSIGLDCSLMKIDVEGHELEVLQGAIETIERCRPILYIEDDRDDKRAALYKFVRDLGYTIEVHEPPMYRANNFAGKTVNIWGMYYISKNIICRPC